MPCDINKVRILTPPRAYLTLFCSCQAVNHVSKTYLPHMSSLLSSQQGRVHTGDSLAFLTANTSTYDAFITESSESVGPAVLLFQPPYFQLLHDALASTQVGGGLSYNVELVVGLMVGGN